MKRISRILPILAIGVAALALGWVQLKESRSAPPPPVEGGALASSSASIRMLLERFLQALHEGDEAKLRQMALNKLEFKMYVWPHLPSSRPGTNLSADYVWEQMQPRTRAGFHRTFQDHGGRRYQLEGWSFKKGEKDYGGFVIHGDARISVFEENGEKRTLNLFGSVIEREGEFKIYSYVR
ncbi:MAG TPA: hypothetical protein VMN76_11225 [Acidobacteriota bacterium]|nr:hypothetical protein [Acidobacteriota bacterium]